MFGLDNELVVSIPDVQRFYSLYADGVYARKIYDAGTHATLLAYPKDAALALYYVYPNHRTACLVRNTTDGAHALPGLSKQVSVIFTVRASSVDKLKRALAFLNKHAGGAFRFDDGFYIRLYFILCRRGKLDYAALRKLTERRGE
ncbi:MAG: hypothetical protein LBD20_00965 [Spirochaetaceae bacterium]|jgi:hypothetical protein|nr:hypothetical protein [Spirochaetaceae bacterium]